MIKGIFHLVNDVNARAGDYLIMREDDLIAVVSRTDLDGLFSPSQVSASVEEPVVVAMPRKKRQWKSAETLERMRANGRRLAEVRRRQREAAK